jgi:hypothetical protein
MGFLSLVSKEISAPGPVETEKLLHGDTTSARNPVRRCAALILCKLSGATPMLLAGHGRRSPRRSSAARWGTATRPASLARRLYLAAWSRERASRAPAARLA